MLIDKQDRCQWDFLIMFPLNQAVVGEGMGGWRKKGHMPMKTFPPHHQPFPWDILCCLHSEGNGAGKGNINSFSMHLPPIMYVGITYHVAQSSAHDSNP